MKQFVIRKESWFGWQMLPGYTGEHYVPYCSPIYVTDFQPLKSGKGRFRIAFINALYAEGVQDFILDVQVLKRAKDYLVGELIYAPGEDSGKCAIVSHIEFEWLRQFCPEILSHRPPSTCSGAALTNVGQYLSEVFLRG